jgi:hypothetical protein
VLTPQWHISVLFHAIIARLHQYMLIFVLQKLFLHNTLIPDGTPVLPLPILPLLSAFK